MEKRTVAMTPVPKNMIFETMVSAPYCPASIGFRICFASTMSALPKIVIAKFPIKNGSAYRKNEEFEILKLGSAFFSFVEINLSAIKDMQYEATAERVMPPIAPLSSNPNLTKTTPETNFTAAPQKLTRLKTNYFPFYLMI